MCRETDSLRTCMRHLCVCLVVSRYWCLLAGYHTGYIHGTGKDNELQLDYSWTDPLAGSGRDIVQFVDSGRLIVHHRVAVGNTSVSYKDVYVRAPRSPMK